MVAQHEDEGGALLVEGRLGEQDGVAEALLLLLQHQVHLLAHLVDVVLVLLQLGRKLEEVARGDALVEDGLKGRELLARDDYDDVLEAGADGLLDE